MSQIELLSLVALLDEIDMMLLEAHAHTKENSQENQFLLTKVIEFIQLVSLKVEEIPLTVCN